MRDELSSLTANGVYEVCSLLVRVAALTGERVQKIMRGTQGEIERFKGRYLL